MTRTLSLSLIALSLLAAGWVSMRPPAMQTGYTITDLSAGDFKAGAATRINRQGQVTGRMVLRTGEHRPFLHNGVEQAEVSMPGGASGVALGLNDSGRVVGAAYAAGSNAEQAFFFDGTTLVSLGTLGGARSIARAINRYDQIVGESDTSLGAEVNPHAFLYGGGVMRDLGTLGGAFSTATSINDAGQVIGYSQTASGDYHAFLYSGGLMTDIGTAPSYPHRHGDGAHSAAHGVGGGTLAWGINNGGVIVGVSRGQAFAYSGGVMRGLGVLPGYTESVALAINDRGEVVGYSLNHLDERSRAFIYRNGVMQDLNDLIPQGTGWEMIQAVGINDAGQIVGRALLDGKPHAFLLTPAK